MGKKSTNDYIKNNLSKELLVLKIAMREKRKQKNRSEDRE